MEMYEYGMDSTGWGDDNKISIIKRLTASSATFKILTQIALLIAFNAINGISTNRKMCRCCSVSIV